MIFDKDATDSVLNDLLAGKDIVVPISKIWHAQEAWKLNLEKFKAMMRNG